MDEKLTIDITRLDPEGEDFAGEVDCVGLDESFVKSFGGVRYELNARLYGTELLVRGRLEQDFDLVCSRCGCDFDDTVKVDDFMMSYEIAEKATEVDLTEDVRESIILALASFPVCREDCPGIEQATARPADSRWSALENLDVRNS